MKIRFHATTHVGLVREGNEDRYLTRATPPLFAVADGMGGHAAGEIAAGIAIRELRRRAKVALDVPHFDPKSFFERTFRQANDAIHADGDKNKGRRGMGTTLTTLHLRNVSHAGEPMGLHALVGHAGDSRCYLVRGDEGRQITTDHGRGHVLDNCLGGYPDWFSKVDIHAEKIIPGDVLVLATDGLNYGCKTASAIARMRGKLAPKELAELLVQSALDGGGHDNVTVIVVEVAE